jgi:pyridoxamine 5'-phosphate oxidase
MPTAAGLGSSLVDELRRRDLEPDPLQQFAGWFEAARAAGGRLPEAVALATATPDGAPSVRMVLLKGFDEDGFVFYSGYDSRKGSELAANPRAALLFYWDALGRQVRIEGPVERVSADESDAYWATRPLRSRLSAAASEQSAPVGSREELEERVAALSGEPPRPERWGGYRLAPEAYEFWLHRDDRLHDRFRYERDAAGWRIDRLQP